MSKSESFVTTICLTAFSHIRPNNKVIKPKTSPPNYYQASIYETPYSTVLSVSEFVDLWTANPEWTYDLKEKKFSERSGGISI